MIDLLVGNPAVVLQDVEILCADGRGNLLGDGQQLGEAELGLEPLAVADQHRQVGRAELAQLLPAATAGRDQPGAVADHRDRDGLATAAASGYTSAR